MFRKYFQKNRLKFLGPLMLALSVLACVTSQPSDLLITPNSIWATGKTPVPGMANSTASLSYTMPATRVPGAPVLSPTPDASHYQTTLARDDESYIVQPGDMLSAIARKYNVSVQALADVNGILNVNALEVGQVLTIPIIPPQPTGPGNKIIPDSELVYGPLSTQTDLEKFIASKDGYLANYSQEVNGETLTAAQVILQAALDSSINPRILLAILEHRSGWLTKMIPAGMEEQPLGFYDDWYNGLYRQMEWAAIHLNSGYYRWRSNNVTAWVTGDGSVVPIDPTINSGTAGIQNLFAQLDDYPTWLKDVSNDGFFSTYVDLFGYPFDMAIEPLIPANLRQPNLQLPFGTDETWSFTGGPHLAWDVGTPLGALDFAPPGKALGCVSSDAWVTAMAGGVVTRTGNGEVILDLDGDGNEGSGWVILYMHIESRDRVQPGDVLMADSRNGHPSCEGGISSGTHVHIARKFNGEWISAIGTVPFNLSGWISTGTGEEYIGSLARNGSVVENYEGNSEINQIQR